MKKKINGYFEYFTSLSMKYLSIGNGWSNVMLACFVHKKNFYAPWHERIGVIHANLIHGSKSFDTDFDFAEMVEH